MINYLVNLFIIKMNNQQVSDVLNDFLFKCQNHSAPINCVNQPVSFGPNSTTLNCIIDECLINNGLLIKKIGSKSITCEKNNFEIIFEFECAYTASVYLKSLKDLKNNKNIEVDSCDARCCNKLHNFINSGLTIEKYNKITFEYLLELQIIDTQLCNYINESKLNMCVDFFGELCDKNLLFVLNDHMLYLQKVQKCKFGNFIMEDKEQNDDSDDGDVNGNIKLNYYNFLTAYGFDYRDDFSVHVFLYPGNIIETRKSINDALTKL